MEKHYYEASLSLEEDILLNRRPDSPPELRMVIPGFEPLISGIYRLQSGDQFLDLKLKHNDSVMALIYNLIGVKILEDYKEIPDNTFKRITISMEKPLPGKPSVEIAFGIWGKGWQVPIHGHNNGYMYEEILKGKIAYKHYRIVDPVNKLVEITKEFTEGTGFSSSDYYESEQGGDHTTLIHSFEILEPTISVHFIPGSPGDGRDYLFKLKP